MQRRKLLLAVKAASGESERYVVQDPMDSPLTKYLAILHYLGSLFNFLGSSHNEKNGEKPFCIAYM